MDLNQSYEELRDIAEQLEFTGDNEYIMGGNARTGRAKYTGFVHAGPEYPQVVSEVGMTIYQRFYIRTGPGRGPYRAMKDLLLKTDFMRRLHQVNTSRWAWAPGWEIVSEDGDQIVIRNRHGDQERVKAENVMTREDGVVLVREDSGSVSQPGWYHARGELDHPYGHPPTIRLYWSLCWQGAAPMVAASTRLFNEAGIPFRLKVTDDPQRYTRADSGVLYFPGGYWEKAMEVLPKLYEAVGPYTCNRTPAMTLPIGRGVGYAVDPGGDESFGMHRARLIAEGLFDAYKAGVSDDEGRLRFVAERFDRENIDIKSPFTNRDVPAPTTELGTLPVPTVEVAA